MLYFGSQVTGRLARPGVFVSAFCLLASAAAAQQPRIPPGVELIPDVVYGKAGERPLRLDIARPKAPPPGRLPVIVFIHGGGFHSGSRKNPYNLPLAARGYFTVNIGYRLTGEAKWPAQIHDCKAAIRWIRANANRYNLNPDRIGVWGRSAGGGLAALIGTSGDVPELEGNSGNVGYSTRVTCVLDFFGPTDFLTMTRPAGDANAPQLFDTTAKDPAEVARAASAITYVSSDDPPFFITHGRKDRTVPFSQSERFHEALRRAGVTSIFVPLPNAAHGGPEFENKRLLQAMLDFFNHYLLR